MIELTIRLSDLQLLSATEVHTYLLDCGFRKSPPPLLQFNQDSITFRQDDGKRYTTLLQPRYPSFFWSRNFRSPPPLPLNRIIRARPSRQEQKEEPLNLGPLSDPKLTVEKAAAIIQAMNEENDPTAD